MRLPPSQLPFHSFFNLPYEYFNQSFCLNLPKRVFSLNSNVLIKIPPSKNQWQQILTHQKQCRPVSPKSQAISALHLNHCRPTNIITKPVYESERFFRKFPASLRKLTTIADRIRLNGNAVTMLMLWRLAIELLENSSATGKTISRTRHMNWINMEGSCPSSSFR